MEKGLIETQTDFNKLFTVSTTIQNKI